MPSRCDGAAEMHAGWGGAGGDQLLAAYVAAAMSGAGSHTSDGTRVAKPHAGAFAWLAPLRGDTSNVQWGPAGMNSSGCVVRQGSGAPSPGRLSELGRLLPGPRFQHARPHGPAPDTPKSLGSRHSPHSPSLEGPTGLGIARWHQHFGSFWDSEQHSHGSVTQAGTPAAVQALQVATGDRRMLQQGRHSSTGSAGLQPVDATPHQQASMACRRQRCAGSSPGVYSGGSCRSSSTGGARISGGGAATIRDNAAVLGPLTTCRGVPFLAAAPDAEKQLQLKAPPAGGLRMERASRLRRSAADDLDAGMT